MTNPRGFTLYDSLLHSTERSPDACALIEGGRTATFAQLLDSVDQLGSGLAREGLGRGDRIAIISRNSLRMAQLLLACARQGVLAIPVNWRWQPLEMTQFLERARPKALFFDQPALDLGLAVAAALAEREVPLDLRVEMDAELEAESSGARGFPELLHRRLRPAPELPADSPYCIIATAAVDAFARGALLSHDNLLTAGVLEGAALSLTAADGNLVDLPLFHIAGLGHFLSSLQVGARNVIMSTFDAAAAVELIDRHQLTMLATFPPMLSQVLDHAQEQGTELASLRWVLGLDSPETIARLHDHTNADFVTGFGQTETSGFVTLQNARSGPLCAGRPVDLCRVAIHPDSDDASGSGATDGDTTLGEIVGEIVVRGPLVFLGYDRLPEVNDRTFRDGWHHTGDLGSFDAQGNLHYAGRKPEKELIKPGGENVYPAEVEAVLVEIAGVRRACVFGTPHPKWGEGISAVLEVEPGVEITLEQARQFVGERIARFKRPHSLSLTPSLPMLADGTLDRARTKREFGESRAGSVADGSGDA